MAVTKKQGRGRLLYLNFGIALLALIFSIPSMLNQANQFFRERVEFPKTEVVHYSPPNDADYPEVDEVATCWGSVVSARADAFRCSTGNNFLYDPCFSVENMPTLVGDVWARDLDVSWFYCPDSWLKGSKDVTLTLKRDKVELPTYQPEERTEEEDGIAWLAILNDGTECRLISGAVDRAYGWKGNNLACNGEGYASVTVGAMEDGRYYFDCKAVGETLFKRCYSRQLVF